MKNIAATPWLVSGRTHAIIAVAPTANTLAKTIDLRAFFRTGPEDDAAEGPAARIRITECLPTRRNVHAMAATAMMKPHAPPSSSFVGSA